MLALGHNLLQPIHASLQAIASLPIDKAQSQICAGIVRFSVPPTTHLPKVNTSKLGSASEALASVTVPHLKWVPSIERPLETRELVSAKAAASGSTVQVRFMNTSCCCLHGCMQHAEIRGVPPHFTHQGLQRCSCSS